MDRLKQFCKWINKKVAYQNNGWYVSLALVATIFQIWTTLIVKDTNTQVKNIQSYLSGAYNSQDTVSSIGMDGKEFIEKYYESLAKQDYTTACGFESNRRCEKSDTALFQQYAKDKKRVWFAKLEDGEHLKEIWKPTIQSDNISIESYCIRKEFTIKGETSPIMQTERMDLLNRPNGEKEIASVICEKATKNGEDRTNQMGCGQSNICNN